MFPMPQYRNPVSLIPGGCPQLLDFAAPLSLSDSVSYSFEEIRQTDPDGETRVYLHAFRKNSEGEFVDEQDPARPVGGESYELKARKAILPWLGKWIPVPFLRTREQTWPDSDEPRFEKGPANWARARLSLDRETPDSLRVVLAFDMGVEDKAADVYAALTPQDVDANAHFRLAWRFRDNAWFMDLAWVEEWLRELWDAWRKRQRRGQTDDERQFDHLAHYLTTLEVLEQAIRNCEVYVIRPDPKSCVDVDLVLDIGNSRTTGILVETHTKSATNLNDSYLLQLRDMDEPDRISTEPFETRVEFSEISFGNDALSLRSGRRTPAFAWPSPVRIGPEAARLATLSRCEQGSTGMSSPKRYLWDERNWKRTWRFNTKSEKAPYVTRGPLAQRINSSGTPLCCMEDRLFTRNSILKAQERESAFESLFTRSSLMMFLLVEIIQQALLTINSPGQRCRREASAEPRRLRQVIFTVPGGMPLAEQKIYKRWAKWAVHVLWEALGWGQYYVENPARRRHGEAADYRTNPVIRCDWDEATCTQLVFIYNEITRKFQGDALLFCEIMGRPRAFPGRTGDVPSVRVATIDIGGGTTDLSITTFELASNEGSTPRMAPHPEFHDGFNLAGDDILRAVVAEHVLEAIGTALAEAGIKNTRAALAALFGRDTMDSSKERLNQRIQFIRQVAVPAALRVLSIYEQEDVRAQGSGTVFRLRDCFVQPAEESEAGKSAQQGRPGAPASETPKDEAPPLFSSGLAPMPSASALRYLTDYVREHGGKTEFDPLNIAIRVDPRRVDDTVRTTLREVLANLCEVINVYGCDVLLLTGRPSRWPGIVESICSLLPVPPSRIFPMGDYRVGGWYPFSDALGNMTDPKTTVVVGAILCALAEGQLEGFSFDPHGLSLASTARYIGEMELNGQIRASKVWFAVDPEHRKVEPEVAEISFSGPLAVGFRQLAAERWTTTRYYLLEFVNDDVRRDTAHRLPFTVRLRLDLPEDDEGSQGAEAAQGEGGFSIEEVLDRNGDGLSGKVLDIRLQTLPRDEGFWMDTGIVYGD